MAGTEVLPLTPDRWADVAELFGRRGADGGCWCMFWRDSATDYGQSTNQRNRHRLQGLAAEDPAPGLIAYREGRAVGWIGLGPRRSFERLNRSRTLTPVDDLPVWSIVCFFVHRQARGAGVTADLLEAAVAYAREHGAVGLEGYPVGGDGPRLKAALAYVGTVGMFRRAGFRTVRETEASSGGRPRWMVRLEFDRVAGAASADQ